MWLERKEIIDEGIRFSKSKNGDDGGREWKMKRYIDEKGRKLYRKGKIMKINIRW